jgi:hypothetical protein
MAGGLLKSGEIDAFNEDQGNSTKNDAKARRYIAGILFARQTVESDDPQRVGKKKNGQIRRMFGTL